MVERDLPKVEIGVRFPLLAHVKHYKTYQEFQARVWRTFFGYADRAEFPRDDYSRDFGFDCRRVAAAEILAMDGVSNRERPNARG